MSNPNLVISFCSTSSGTNNNNNVPGEIYYKPFDKDLGDLEPLRDFARPGNKVSSASHGGGMRDAFDHDKRLYYTSQEKTH